MNIYISNLSSDVSDNDLKELFDEYGAISSAKVITDKLTGMSRGFGFVDMPNSEEAVKAIKELDKAEYDGKVIMVAEAKPKKDKPRSNYDRDRRGGYNSERSGKRW